MKPKEHFKGARLASSFSNGNFKPIKTGNAIYHTNARAKKISVSMVGGGGGGAGAAGQASSNTGGAAGSSGVVIPNGGGPRWSLGSIVIEEIYGDQPKILPPIKIALQNQFADFFRQKGVHPYRHNIEGFERGDYTHQERVIQIKEYLREILDSGT